MYNPVVDPSKKHYGSNFWDCYSSKIDRDVHFYSELEYDHWIHIETNANIVEFCEKPKKIKGILDNKIHETTFDMWIKWKDGKEEFLEVAYKKNIETSNSTKRRIQLHQEWCKNNNYNYRILNEDEIRKQPLLDNLKVMLPYTKNFDKVNEILIFSLLKNIKQNPVTFRDLMKKITQVDTYSFYLNIIYLYYQGEINIDLEEEYFNHLSKVWKKNE
ncbi:TnsA endonuclease N-terminal domain-containing protein [Virgibacillus oceani]|uniref:TnsA endonuclease N-terminal domain-containing protein n=1 Tax=Virgibacillus oceani TaxID=1479511 RepID=A0A917HGC1_9BACI|nr:TnsA endonuclease N-terminal domain-containing protein [Virgibacillus oceani]GGG77589.1 hypothetical protein GCM10011398_23390 [Virgibacillus oceani]